MQELGGCGPGEEDKGLDIGSSGMAEG